MVRQRLTELGAAGRWRWCEQWWRHDKAEDRYNYLYTSPELEKWKGRIEAIAGKAPKTFVVANNHFEGKAAVNALQLKSMLHGGQVKVPETLAQHYWELGEIAASNASEDE